MAGILLFSFCIFTILATLGYILYLKKGNQEKIDTILFRSLGGMAFLTFWALNTLTKNDALGISGLFCYVWTIEIMLIVLAQLTAKRKNIGICAAFLIYIITSCFFAFKWHRPHLAYTFFAIPIIIYFIFYGISKVIENKLQNKFPLIFHITTQLSLYLLLLNIILILGIAVYDLHIF